jgi:predicted ribosome quality control (RQC) complex YloA/Tae2 family protein
MLFDSTMLCRIAADIERSLTGSNVGRVLQNAYDEVCLEMRAKGDKPQIVLSCNAEFGRVALSGECEPAPGSADFAFGNALRKHLRGATLTAVRQVNYDRILELDFANCEGLGPQSKRRLIAEIMGRHANLVLIDAGDAVGQEGEILACARQVTDRVNRYRQTVPGYFYLPPPGGEKLDPSQVAAMALRAGLGESGRRPRAGEEPKLRAAVRAVVSGGSDIFIEEALARAGMSADDYIADLAPEAFERLAGALRAVAAEARASGPGFVYTDPQEPDRGPVFAYPIALRSRLEWDAAQTPDLSEATEGLCIRLRGRQATQQTRHRLQVIVTAALQKAATREQERRRALDKAQGADGMRQRGELILSQLHAIAPRAAVAKLVDYYAEGAPEIEVELDPKRSPQEYAQALFDRYRKLKRVQERVPPLLQEAAQEREYLEGVIDQIELAEGPDELREIEAELAQEGYVKEKRKITRPTGRPSDRIELPRFNSPDGYTILYGKTGIQNDEVIRQSDNNDIWLHVKDGPGGHVLIRTGNKPDKVPESTLIAAAKRAALNSKWRRDSVVEVNYTLAKHLHKPRYGRPGFVYYSEFRTIAVRPG